MSLCGILGSIFIQSSGVCFRMAVSMGRTRRAFLLWQPLLSMLTVLLGMLVSWCLYQIENMFYHVIYPDYIEELIVEVVFQWWIVALTAVILSVIGLLIGALQIRFGANGMAVFWIIFFAGCWVLPHAVNQAKDGRTSLMARLGGGILTAVNRMTPVAWCGVGLAAFISAVIFSVAVYRNAEIRI